MTRETALRMLGLVDGATLTDVEQARRKLISALHSDGDSSEAKVFERRTKDILEAYTFLIAGGQRVQPPIGCKPARSHPPRIKPSDPLSDALFDPIAAASWSEAKSERGSALVAFDRKYVADRVLAIAIYGLDPALTLSWSSAFTGDEATKVSTALYVTVLNRTKHRVEYLDASKGVLVDDKGHQYSAEGSFYWRDSEPEFHQHSTTIAPNARLDGFVTFPQLRRGSSNFERWFLYVSLNVGDATHYGQYGVALGQDPQAREVSEGTELDLDTFEDNLIAGDGELTVEVKKDRIENDRWLYGLDR